jgi:predicted RNA-binding Zn-ribbon protein involved in translation (DUF1610 family)
VSDLERRTCAACRSVHELKRYDLQVIDHRASLACPNCGEELIAWTGREFFSYVRQIMPAVADESPEYGLNASD